MRIFRLLTLATVIAAPVALHATPITYTESFIGSGSLGGTSFTNQLITLMGVGDTDNVTNPSSGIFANVLPVTFSIAGGASGTFTDEVQFAANQIFGRAGVGDITKGLAIMFTADSAFDTYDLTTLIGPITEAAAFNPGDSFATNLGAFSIGSAGASTFEASSGVSAVPEPSSLILLGTGALGALGMMRRKLFAA